MECQSCFGTGRNRRGGPCVHCRGTGEVRGIASAGSMMSATGSAISAVVFSLVGLIFLGIVIASALH